MMFLLNPVHDCPSKACLVKKLVPKWSRARVRRSVISIIAISICCASVRFAYGQGSVSGSSVTAISLPNTLSAAQQGDVQAQISLGRAYAEGTVGAPNYAEALKWLQTASGQGSMEADAWIGSLYLLGHGVPQDANRAATLIQAAAAASSPAGLRFLGFMYETGQGVSRDYAQAAGFYTQAVAQQDANACDRLGLLYLQGLGVSKDPVKAFNLFTLGAGGGDRWAQLHLGQMYQSGHIPSASAPSTAASTNSNSTRKIPRSAPDYATAMKLYAASAAQRNRIATYKVGVLYENGLGVAQDYSKALSYYAQSGSQRYGPALLAYGRIYELGLGTTVNLANAYVGYSLAAQAGAPAASERLQSLLHKLSAADLQSAQTLLKAAQQGTASAGSTSN